MVVLHGGGGVDGCQGRSDVDHELVVEAAMVQVVTDRTNEHGQTLKPDDWAFVFDVKGQKSVLKTFNANCCFSGLSLPMKQKPSFLTTV